MLKTLAKSRDVKVVEELIDEIGEVDIDSGKAIEEAQDAYDELTPSERREVENYSVLEDAIEAYNMIPIGTWVATYTEDTYYYYDRSTRYDHFPEPGDTVEIIAELSSDGRGEAIDIMLIPEQQMKRDRFPGVLISMVLLMLVAPRIDCVL